uniref:ARAD1C42020p n=1 Tax=Blastobotrys adeninivorans TaxID=409370 RepID=A0A060T4M3_BLAAD
MSLPPQTTVVCIGIPEGYLFGIDTQFFQTTPQFRGIKLIPDGVHVVHWGSDEQSVRSGHFFVASDHGLVILRWDPDNEQMILASGMSELDVSAVKSRLGEYYSFMVSYPSLDSWQELTNHITQSTLSLVPQIVTSSSTSVEENALLKKSLYDSARERAQQSGTAVEEDRIIQSVVDQGDKGDILQFTAFDLKKTWRDDAIGRERTEQARDKTWFLNEVVLPKCGFYNLLGELQLGFVTMIILANYSGAQQWMKIVQLLGNSLKDMELRPERYSILVRLLLIQLQTLPEEYFESFVDKDQFQTVLENLDAMAIGSEYLSKLMDKAAHYGIIIDNQEDPDFEPVVVDE